MSTRLQSIENALKSMNDAVFQELCDCYLLRVTASLRTFGRSGSQIGKQKTVKGTPDTYYQLENGKYVFVETTTNISEGVGKIVKDVGKCLNEDETGIPINQISEIVICLNFTLSPEEHSRVQTVIDSQAPHIKLCVYQLQGLAADLLIHHSDLCNRLLGLPFDSGQIVPLSTFISEYNNASSSIATPIDNAFLHRESEMGDFLEKVINNDLVVLTGAPGVGKTKLVVEGLMRLEKEYPEYSVFCVANKHYDLLVDLKQHIQQGGKYILFVDDANRIDRLDQILGFYQGNKESLKIVITVREYALTYIRDKCSGIIDPSVINIEKFSNEQIEAILRSPSFGILNPNYLREINRIADGNPRFAIMAARLCIDKQNLSVLYDVSDMFELYFSTFIQDKKDLNQKTLIQAAGIVAFFYALPYKDLDFMTGIIEDFGLNYNDFITSIEALDRLEMVDIQYEYVKIPEQNLATFFFYKAFIKDGLLSFDTLFSNYSSDFGGKMDDLISSIYHSFGAQRVTDVLTGAIKNYLPRIAKDEKQKIDLFTRYGFFAIAEVQSFLLEHINSLEVVSGLKYGVLQGDPKERTPDKIMSLLGAHFYESPNLKNFIDLSFEYVLRKPASFKDLIAIISQNFGFRFEDESSKFIKQEILFKKLFVGIQSKDDLSIKVFLSIASKFLKCSFEHISHTFGNTYNIYRYSLSAKEPTTELRKLIFENLISLYKDFPTEVLNIFKSYAKGEMDDIAEVLKEEQSYVLDFIRTNLSKVDFENCLLVKALVDKYKRTGLYSKEVMSLEKEFKNYEYDLYLTLSSDQVKGKTMLDFKRYEDFERLQLQALRDSVGMSSTEDVDKFYSAYLFIQEKFKDRSNYSAQLDVMVDELFSIDRSLGIYFLRKIIEGNAEIRYIPILPFKNHINTEEDRLEFWSLLNHTDFPYRGLWKFNYFRHLQDQYLEAVNEVDILTLFQELRANSRISLHQLEKYFDIFPDLCLKIMSQIADNMKNFNIMIEIIDLEHILIKYQIDIDVACGIYLSHKDYADYIDYNGNALLQLLKQKPDFLVQYIEHIYKKDDKDVDHKIPLGFIWCLDEIEAYIERIIDFFVKKDKYYLGIMEHFVNSFFTEIPNEYLDKAQNFIRKYVDENHSDTRKMNLIVDILRHSMTSMSDEILIHYLKLNPDVDKFEKIYWFGNGSSYSGNVNMGDIEAGKYTALLGKIRKADLGIALIPLEKHLQDCIDEYKRSAEEERKRKFIRKDY